MTPESLAREVKALGRRLGFDRIAVGPADPPEHADAFSRWVFTTSLKDRERYAELSAQHPELDLIGQVRKLAVEG